MYIYQFLVKTNQKANGRTLPLCLLLVTLFLTMTASANAQPLLQELTGIQGVVYRDFNANGVFEPDILIDYTETGVANINVTVYDKEDNIVGNTKTDASGHYSVAVPNGLYRIVFDDYETGDYPAPQGSNSGSSVQFVDAPVENVDFGVNYPAQYCQTNPKMCTALFVAGDPLQNSTASTGTVFVSFRYDGSDIPQSPDADAMGREVGAVWGITVQRKTFDVYAAAFVKRHVGLGTLGEGGIYRLSYNRQNMDARPKISAWLDVTTLGVDVGTVGSGATSAERNKSRGLSPIKTLPTFKPERDLQGYDAVGKIGLGGLAISEDGDTLWFINLYQKTLNELVIDKDGNETTPPVSTDLTAYSIPTPNCTQGEMRPFAVKVYRNQVYVGVICDGSKNGTVADLKAVVYAFNGENFAEVFSMPLDYPRQNGPDYLLGACSGSLGWQTWSVDLIEPCGYYGFFLRPQPMLTTLEFDVDGSLLLGFNDRGAHQFGYKNTPIKDLASGYKDEYYATTAGDLVRACWVNGSFQLEGSADCPQHIDEGYPYNAGAGGNLNLAEYYHEDVLRAHLETSLGGIAFLAGSGEVTTTAIDPYNTIASSGGINWFSNATGLSRPSGYVIYEGGNDQNGHFSKAGGLGDIDLLCDEAPIEIGNRVWLDSNKNGIQDAGEPPLADVKVELVHNGKVIATAITNENGNYLFSNAPGESQTAFIYNLALISGEIFEVRIPFSSQSEFGQALWTLALTESNANGITSNLESDDRIDSDGEILEDFARVQVLIGLAGQNNHSLDFGFIQLDLPTETPTATATNTATNTATFTATASATPTATETVTNTATDTPIATETVTNTATDTPTATETVTNTATDTPTATETSDNRRDGNTHTPTPSVTNTPSQTPTASASATASVTPTTSLANTSTFTATSTNTANATSTTSQTASATPTNSATLTATHTPAITSTLTPTVTPSPLLLTPIPASPTISKQANVSVAKPGDMVVWTILVRNPGNQRIESASVQDTLDVRLQYLGAVSTKGNVSFDGKKLVVELGSLEAGESVQITLQTQVKSDTLAPAQIPNQATLLLPNGEITTTANIPVITIIPPALPRTGSHSEHRQHRAIPLFLQDGTDTMPNQCRSRRNPYA
jgi:hypothetical protein